MRPASHPPEPVRAGHVPLPLAVLASPSALRTLYLHSLAAAIVSGAAEAEARTLARSGITDILPVNAAAGIACKAQNAKEAVMSAIRAAAGIGAASAEKDASRKQQFCRRRTSTNYAPLVAMPVQQ